ncbi:SH3-domain-containing protein [Dendrothele bispora CBS 962.96]|uniref:SH3-domain-containing protein n=1 Tax=Dendrothele bispora (strain CBS 962.96) TaxID=1314807 RepID=A0A4S8MJL8_DENBC|nr:SH3-domain-containing protein [Dendrothele bispora CBS 962.96]
MASNDSLLAHIASQVESNVRLLAEQGYIPRAQADSFLSTLANAGQSSIAPPAARSMPIPSPFGRKNSAPPVAATPSLPQAKALWPYNENGTDSDDLSFSAGDIIEIVEETNADWWMGRVNGKEALFPSSYVEKVQASAPVTPAPAAPVTPARAAGLPPAFTGTKEKTPYKAFGAAHQGANAPPPPGQGVNSSGLQQDPGQEAKKSKYGKYGNTMAHSAAGGVGFGAGSAIGGGLVRAIF